MCSYCRHFCEECRYAFAQIKINTLKFTHVCRDCGYTLNFHNHCFCIIFINYSKLYGFTKTLYYLLWFVKELNACLWMLFLLNLQTSLLVFWFYGIVNIFDCGAKSIEIATFSLISTSCKTKKSRTKLLSNILKYYVFSVVSVPIFLLTKRHTKFALLSFCMDAIDWLSFARMRGKVQGIYEMPKMITW